MWNSERSFSFNEKVRWTKESVDIRRVRNAGLSVFPISLLFIYWLSKDEKKTVQLQSEQSRQQMNFYACLKIINKIRERSHY